MLSVGRSLVNLATLLFMLSAGLTSDSRGSTHEVRSRTGETNVISPATHEVRSRTGETNVISPGMGGKTGVGFVWDKNKPLFLAPETGLEPAT